MPLNVREVDDLARPHRAREVQGLHGPATGDEVHAGVHVSTGVGAHLPLADGGRVSVIGVGYELLRRRLRIVRPLEHLRVYGPGDVYDLHCPSLCTRATARTGEPDPPLTLSGNAMKKDQGGNLSRFFRFSTI